MSEHIVSREAWLKAFRTAKELSEEYGISADPGLLVAFDRPLLLIYGHDPNVFNAARPKEFVARPIKFRVSNGGVAVKYRNGVKTYVPLTAKDEESRVKELVNIVNSYHHVVLNGGAYRVKAIYNNKEDVEAARKVVEAFGKRKALSLAIGLSDIGFEVYWPRATVLVRRGHYFELSMPGSGKSTYAMFMSRVLGGVVMSESPTVTFLIGDARDSSFGVVYTSNIVVFDEVEKYKSDTIRQFYHSLLTGLENCQWTRAAGKGIMVNKCVSVAFLGNQPPEDKSRSGLARLLESTWKVYSAPLLDRISMIYFNAPRFVVDYIGDFLKPSVARGLSRILTEEAESRYQSYVKTYDMRKAWAYAVISTIYSWAKGEEPDDRRLSELYTFGP